MAIVRYRDGLLWDMPEALVIPPPAVSDSTTYSYPGGSGLDDAIRRYADEHAGDATALGDGSVTWSATLDFAPIVKASTLTLPDGTVYDGIAALDVMGGGVTFTPVRKRQVDGDE